MMAQVQKVVLFIALIAAVVLTLTPFTKAADQEYVELNHVKTNKVSSFVYKTAMNEIKDFNLSKI